MSTDQYPNTTEVRDWAMSVNPRAVSMKGALPRAVIAGWNKTHPDRPFVPREAHHGTVAGYGAHGCRCDRCRAACRERRQQDYRYYLDRDAATP